MNNAGLCIDNPDITQEEKDSIRESIGTTFTLNLAEVTEESVLDALTVIRKNPFVEYAVPEYTYSNDADGFERGIVMIGFHEPYWAPLEELFPELDIVEVRDSYRKIYDVYRKSSYATDDEKNLYRDNLRTIFQVKLTQETRESVLEAIDVIMESPLVKYAVLDHRTYPTDIEQKIWSSERD